MSIEVLAAIAGVLAAIPAVMFHQNLQVYAPPPVYKPGADTDPLAVSVLIPARNEAGAIRAAVEAALQSEHVRLEVIVLDDHSTDATATIVREIAAQDWCVRLVHAPLLPPGWCGKQHACAVLATLASHPILVFVDADVRLAPHGLVRLGAFLNSSGAGLISGLPRQEMETFVERLVLPLMHFLLLGFLPMQWMRRSRHPAFGSGCGQLFMARRDAYEAAGGHAAIRTSLHDGLTLPRAFRAAGLRTDLCDATEVATCRMYRNAREVWYGLAKNATEGLASAALIVPATVLLLGGQVLPLVLLGLGGLGRLSLFAAGLAGLGVLAAYYPRLRAVRRFGQPWREALLSPLGVLLLLAIQWYARGRALWGYPATWKGRTYTASETRGYVHDACGCACHRRRTRLVREGAPRPTGGAITRRCTHSPPGRSRRVL
jgi:glycosyltransferase involved in cell wall biosynthesis